MGGQNTHANPGGKEAPGWGERARKHRDEQKSETTKGQEEMERLSATDTPANQERKNTAGPQQKAAEEKEGGRKKKRGAKAGGKGSSSGRTSATPREMAEKGG